MSLKSALVAYKQAKKEKDITDIIQTMLMEQQRLLDGWCVNNTVNKGGDITKVKKEWNENVLTEGGISYYKLNDKRYKVSVCNDDNDVVLKYWFKNALGIKVSISAKALKEAQQVVDSIYGKGKYNLSASKN